MSSRPDLQAATTVKKSSLTGCSRAFAHVSVSIILRNVSITDSAFRQASDEVSAIVRFDGSCA